TLTWTSPDWSRSARSASRVLNRARSGAALADGFSRHIAPPVDEPAQPVASPPAAIKATSAHRRQPIIATPSRQSYARVYRPPRAVTAGAPASKNRLLKTVQMRGGG